MSYVQSLRNTIYNLLVRKPVFQQSSLHEELLKEDHADYDSIIDKACYEDLHVRDFRERYYELHTSFGDELLDHWLRSTKRFEQLHAIQRDITTLNEKSDLRSLIERLLVKTGKQGQGYFVDDLWHGFSIDSKIITYSPYIVMSNFAFVFLAVFFFPAQTIIWLLLFLLINILSFNLVDRRVGHLSGSIHYLIRGMQFISRLERKQADVLSVALPDISELARIRHFALFFRETQVGLPSDDITTLFVDYLRIFLGLQIFAFHFTKTVVQKHYLKTRRVLYCIGYYDVLVQSAIIYQNNNCTFTQHNTAELLAYDRLTHPLLEKPVGQSLSFSKGAVITGLNMAGKSTMMRSVGLNQLIAMSLGYAFADKYCTNELVILSSFRISDLLLAGKSRYFAEAERIASIVKAVSSRACLVLIDEILTGTNSEERILAAVAILTTLAEQKESIVLTATHDSEIAQQLGSLYQQIYFDGEVIDGAIIFDYQPKPGIVSRHNGLKILRALGLDV